MEFAAFDSHPEAASSQGSGSYATPRKRAAAAEEPKEKRFKLRHYDLAPAQCLNPMGVSHAEDIDIKRFWQLVCKGNQSTLYFSELCSPLEVRRLIGLSRTAQVMFEAISYMETNKEIIEKVKKPEIAKAVFAEAGVWV